MLSRRKNKIGDEKLIYGYSTALRRIILRDLACRSHEPRMEGKKLEPLASSRSFFPLFVSFELRATSSISTYLEIETEIMGENTFERFSFSECTCRTFMV